MPKYRFTCPKCNKEKSTYTSASKKTIKCKCGNDMKRELPNLSGSPKVLEIVDKYSNVKHQANQTKIIQDRRNVYYWAVEVPKMVESGVYSMETMMEKLWIYYDEKGNLQTRTKPPTTE